MYITSIDTDIPSVNVCQNHSRLTFTMKVFQILLYPSYQMVFESAFDDLVKEVTTNHLITVCPGEVICERLLNCVSILCVIV